MEYGLGPALLNAMVAMLLLSLNPSFNGIWSRTCSTRVYIEREVIVLILLLMEYGLGHFIAKPLLILLSAES